MPSYAQLTPNGIVHTVCELSGEVQGAGIISIPSILVVPSVLGCKYHDGTFYRLHLTASESEINTDQVLSLALSWRDLDGQLVEDQAPITVMCAGVSEVVTADGGQVVVPFESAEPGLWRIEVRCSDGCMATLEVSVVENSK